MNRLSLLFQPVSSASLGVFRITMGLVMLYEFTNMRAYIVGELPNSRFFFTYDFFHWVPMASPSVLSGLFTLGVIAATLMTIGLASRAMTATVFTIFSYVILLDRGHYNNHYYLFCLMCFLLIWTDSGKSFSIDARRQASEPDSKIEDCNSVPYWQVLMLRWQIAIVYFYGGLAKLDADWLRGFPMAIWLPQREHYPVVGPFLASDLAAFAMSYGGLAFDLLVPLALLSKRWRSWAVAPLLIFHLSNHFLWRIGAFPWFAIAATCIFFAPDWPLTAYRKWWRRKPSQAVSASRTSAVARPNTRPLVLAGIALYFAFQTLFPLRHVLFPGNPAWNGQGSLFAWRMMLHDRFDAVRLRIDLPDKGTIGYVDVGQYINLRQFRKLGWGPKAFHRFALYLADEMRTNAGVENAEVYVQVHKSLNGRPYQPLIDPNANLAAEPYLQFGLPDYILPLDPTLRPSRTKGAFSEDVPTNP